MKWVVIILGKGNYYQHHETTEKRNGVKFGRCAEHGMRKGDGGGHADVELKASLAPDDQATRTHPPLSERQKKGVARLLLWRMICTVTLYHRTIWKKNAHGRIHKQRDIDPSDMKTIVAKNDLTYEPVHASMFQKILWQPLMAPHWVIITSH